KFQIMQPGALFAPAFAACDELDVINQRALHPLGRAIPLDIRRPVFQVDGSGSAIQTETAPVPKLEREDIWSGTDLEHHAASAGTVNGPGRNKEVIVSARREPVEVLFSREFEIHRLRALQVIQHRFRIDSLLQPQINTGILLRVQHVIAFVLGIVHSEVFADIRSEWVNLEREVAAADSIEKIEANRKLGAESIVDRSAQQSFGVKQQQVDRRNLHTGVAKAEQQTVLFRSAFKLPPAVGGLAGGELQN